MPDADLEAVHRHLHVAIRRWAHAAAAASAADNRVAFIHRVCALHGDGRPRGCRRGSTPRSAESGSVVPRPHTGTTERLLSPSRCLAVSPSRRGRSCPAIH